MMDDEEAATVAWAERYESDDEVEQQGSSTSTATASKSAQQPVHDPLAAVGGSHDVQHVDSEELDEEEEEEEEDDDGAAAMEWADMREGACSLPECLCRCTPCRPPATLSYLPG
jgi:hypothetical protein